MLPIRELVHVVEVVAHENTFVVVGKGPSPGRELGIASPFAVSPPIVAR